MKELVQSFVSDDNSEGADLSYERLKEYDHFGWFYIIEELVKEESNKMMDFIMQTIGNYAEFLTVQNDKKEYAYEVMMKNQVSHIIIIAFYSIRKCFTYLTIIVI
jgi:hypothetical protein